MQLSLFNYSNKLYKNSPLPFLGQKNSRVIRKEFIKILNLLSIEVEHPVIVDLFGGSGLLSRISKDIIPQARVIYNDFDDFSKRIKNIRQTNILLQDLRNILKDFEVDKKVNNEYKKIILDFIKEKEAAGHYIDYVTISSNLFFEVKYAVNFQQLKKSTFYNRIRINDYDEANDYLQDIEVVKEDYKILYEKYKDNKKALFLLDPPYLTTTMGHYYDMNYWKLSDYLDILLILKDVNYIYFTSQKSSILELNDWFSKNKIIDLFNNATVIKIKKKKYLINYEEYMIYKLLFTPPTSI